MRNTLDISFLLTSLGAILLVGAARAAAPSPPAGADVKSIVDNGGFEDWQPAPDNVQKSLDCPQLPTRWNLRPGPNQTTCSLRRDAAIKHGDSFSVRMSNTDTKSGLSIAQRMDAEPQYRYVVRLWVKGEHIDAYHPKGVIVHVAASSQSDKNDIGIWTGVLRDSHKPPSPNNGTFDWHQLVFAFDTPVDTKSIILLVELRGAGVLWVDDVQVKRLEKCVQVESY